MRSLFLLILLPIVMAGLLCPIGWTMWGGHCYRHFNNNWNDRVYYDEAQRRCGTFGAQLARITSQAELEWLAKFVHLPGYHRWIDTPLIGFRLEPNGSWESELHHKDYPAYFKMCNTTGMFGNSIPGIPETDSIDCTLLIGDNIQLAVEKKPLNYACIELMFCEPREVFYSTGGYIGGKAKEVGFSRFLCKKPID